MVQRNIKLYGEKQKLKEQRNRLDKKDIVSSEDQVHFYLKL